MCASVLSCIQSCNPMDYSPPESSVRGIFLAKNTGVGCHPLDASTPGMIQGIFPTQGLNSHMSPALVGGFFITEPSERPLNRFFFLLVEHHK